MQFPVPCCRILGSNLHHTSQLETISFLYLMGKPHASLRLIGAAHCGNGTTHASYLVNQTQLNPHCHKVCYTLASLGDTCHRRQFRSKNEGSLKEMQSHAIFKRLLHRRGLTEIFVSYYVYNTLFKLTYLFTMLYGCIICFSMEGIQTYPLRMT